MGYLLTRKSRTEEDLIDHLINSSEKRLARPFCFCSEISESKAGRSP
jgi:hypothetical protein